MNFNDWYNVNKNNIEKCILGEVAIKMYFAAFPVILIS